MGGIFFLLLLIGWPLVLLAIHARVCRDARKRMIFTKYLRACVRLQLPLDEAMANFSGTPREIRKWMAQVWHALESGCSLAQSLAGGGQDPEYTILPPRSLVPYWYVRMIDLGERTGALSRSMDLVLVADSRQEELRKKLLDAVMYPVIVCIAIGIVCAATYWGALKFMNRCFIENGELPAQTIQGFVATAELTLQVSMICIAGMVILIIWSCLLWTPGYACARPLQQIRRAFMRILHARSMPFLGRLFWRTACGRWAITTSMLLEAGSSLPDAMRDAAGVEDDQGFAALASEWSARVRNGEKLSMVLVEEPLMPRALIWQVRAAEGGADFIAALRRAGEREVMYMHGRMNVWLRLLGPVMILVVGYGVGTIYINLFRPIIHSVYEMAAW